MIKIRISGSWAEIKHAQKIIADTFNACSISKPYPDRGQADYWRVYINCEERRNIDEKESSN